MENHITVKFATSAKKALHLAFKSDKFSIFSNTYVLPKWPSAKLLFTDTDSLCYHITTADIYSDMVHTSDKFDMAGYNKDFKTINGEQVQNSTNKKVIGKMKDEQAEPCKGGCDRCSGETPLPHLIRAFCGLRAKMYACDIVESVAKKTAKGIKRSHVKKHITFLDFKRALFGDTTKDLRQTATFSVIRSFNHNVSTNELTKTSLCAIDTKRFVQSNNIQTLAYGHYTIR